jgi:hypothetical protein
MVWKVCVDAWASKSNIEQSTKLKRDEQMITQEQQSVGSAPTNAHSAPRFQSTASVAGDLEPISLVLGSLLRRSWLILAVAALAAGIGWTLAATDVDNSSNEATARLGLTQQTEWPFYDVELEAGRFRATTPEFRSRVEDRLGYSLISVDGTLPDSLAVFDLTVVADSPDRAVEAANVAAELMIDLATADVNEIDTTYIEQIDVDIADVQARITEFEAEGDAAGDALTALYIETGSGNDDPALFDQEFDLKETRNRAASARNDLERTLVALETERASVVVRVGGESTLRILRDAVPAEAQDSSQVPVTIAVGFVALLVGSAAAIAVDRRAGPVRSSWQLENIAGAPVHAELRVDSDHSILGCGQLADAIDAGLSNGQSVFGVINLAGAVSLDELAHGLSKHGLPSSVVAGPREAGDELIRLVDVSEEYRDDEAPRSMSRSCDSLILLVDKRQSLSATSAIVTQCTTNPGLLSAAYVRNA